MHVSWRSLVALALLPLAFMATARAQDASDPAVYMVTYLDVTPATRGADAALLRQLAAASRKDPGVVRYEVFQRSAPSAPPATTRISVTRCEAPTSSSV